MIGRVGAEGRRNESLTAAEARPGRRVGVTRPHEDSLREFLKLEDKSAPTRHCKLGRVDRAHGDAHGPSQHAGEPLEDWTVSERDVAADPDATREFENFVKMPIVVNQAGIADDGRCSR